MSSGNAIVELLQLTHDYGARRALSDVCLSVESGAICAILGPNGGGKSTLFKILTTLLTPTSGTARVAGADVVSQRDAVRRAIGVVFQRPSLDGNLTVVENLTHQGHLYGLRGAELRGRVMEHLDAFEISDRSRDRVNTLSGGLQRRVELAKAMLHRPRVLILDEPSTGLDPTARRALFEQLVVLRAQGVTTLLTTHLTDEADRCDRVAVLNSGRLVAFDTPAALKQRIGGDVLTIDTKSPEELAGRINARFGVVVERVADSLRVERARGHEFVPALIEAFPGEIDGVSLGRPTLNDVFVHVTGTTLAEAGRELAETRHVARKKR